MSPDDILVGQSCSIANSNDEKICKEKVTFLGREISAEGIKAKLDSKINFSEIKIPDTHKKYKK